MSASGVWHFLLWLHYFALEIWTGGIVFISAVMAPVVHRSMASKAVAGQIVGHSLKRLNCMEITCCLLLMVTSFSSMRFVQINSHWIWALICVLFLMGSLTSYYAFSLTPRMEALREKVPTLDTLSSGQETRGEFDRLHRLYVRLMSLNLALGLAVLYGSVILLK